MTPLLLSLASLATAPAETPPVDSVSLGIPTRGRLVDGVQLPHDGPHHTVLPNCRARGTSWGTRELVDLVEAVARVVQETAPGPKLAVCNLSREGGGRIEWSKSHRAGRDVDLAFFVTDAESGEAIEAPRLIPMRYSGVSFEQPPRYGFDFPRNWALVRALAMQDEAPVQWIFIRQGLSRRLLRHARAIGEPEAVVARVGLVLKEPSDAAAHGDHYHVRLFCTAEDRAAGCRDVEPRWPWFHPDPRPMAERAFALAEGVRAADEATRSKTLQDLIELDAMDGAPALAELAVFEPGYQLRAKAASMLIEWNAHVGQGVRPIQGWTGPQPRTHRERAADDMVVHAIEAFVRAPGPGVLADDPAFSAEAGTVAPPPEHETKPWVLGEGRAREAVHIVRAYKLLAKLATPGSSAFIRRALRSKRVIGTEGDAAGGTPEARLAALVALHTMDPALVPALIDALGHADSKVRTRADTAIRRITNHTQKGARWGSTADPARMVAQIDWWRQWWVEHQNIPRDELVRKGFRRRGKRFVTLDDEENVPRLVALTKRSDELGYNADRLLVRITGRHTARAADAAEKYAKWSKWYP